MAGVMDPGLVEAPAALRSTLGGRVLSLASRDSIEVPIADLLVDGKLEIYPHVAEKGLLFLQFKGMALTLSAGPFIGLIPLTRNISVDVKPKLPVGNFARVLDVAQRSLSSLSSSERHYLANNSTGGSVLDFLGTNLLDALKPVQENGLLKEYVRKAEATSSPRGRIDLSSTMTQVWTRGQRHVVIASKYEQTSDTAVNRVIKSALRSVLTRLKPATSLELIKALNNAYVGMPSSIQESRPTDIAAATRCLAPEGLPQSRKYYERAVEISLLILSNRGVSLQEYGADVVLQSFIVNFETVFEEYLRRVLESYADAKGVQVQDGNRDGKRPLFSERKDPPAQPDIVVSSPNTGKILIAEVKYKGKPNRDDYNQAVTYALVYGTKRVVLVHQSADSTSSGAYRIGTVGGVTLDGYAFDLANPKLEEQEAAFANLILDSVG